MPPFINQAIDDLTTTSSRALVEASLAQAATSHAVFTQLYPQEAIQAAERADVLRQAGARLSPLAGLPVSIKDLLDVAGEPTCAGSVVLKDAAPAATDAIVVARLRAAGAAIIGKTNMTEFAFSGVGLNPHHGTPANPADAHAARIPGGSSSGAAASVALGLCVAGIGSDTGGSIRIPAALCGLVGFKPTMRRIPVAGSLPLSPTLDTLCAMTRSVRDCLLVDAVIADLALAPTTLSLAGLRLVVPQTVVMDELDAHVAASFTAALSLLSAAGAVIVERPMQLLSQARQINLFAPVEAYAWHQTLLASRGEAYDQRVAKRMRLGANYSAADYAHNQQARLDWISAMEQELAGFDAMLMPTVPIVAPLIAHLETSEEAFFEANRLLLRNPALINLLDGCALSIPCHKTGTLPAGLTVAGLAMTDAQTLAVSLAIEEALRLFRHA